MEVQSQFIEMFGERTTTPVGYYIKDSFPGDWGIEDLDGTGVKVIRTTNFTNFGKLNLSEVVTRSIEERKIQKKQILKYDTILERSAAPQTILWAEWFFLRKMSNISVTTLLKFYVSKILILALRSMRCSISTK